MLYAIRRADFSPTPQIDTNSFVRYETSYQLRFVDSDATDPVVVYAGVANIDVRLIRGQWQVEYWDEIQAEGEFEKAARRYARIVKKYEGTGAARRAQEFLRRHPS